MITPKTMSTQTGSTMSRRPTGEDRVKHELVQEWRGGAAVPLVERPVVAVEEVLRGEGMKDEGLKGEEKARVALPVVPVKAEGGCVDCGAAEVVDGVRCELCAPEFAKVKRCVDCGAEFHGRLMTKRCLTCDAALEAEAARQERQEWLAKRKMEWEDLLGFYHAESFKEHAYYWLTKLEVPIKQAAERWVLQHGRELDKGLGLIGVPGVGKTVAAARNLRLAFMRGHSVAITSDPRITTLAEGLARKETAASSEVHCLLKADLLLIDDLGQSARMGLARDLLYRIVHERHMARRRLIWTAQGGQVWIAGQLGAEMEEEEDAVTGKRTVKARPGNELAAFLRRIWEPFCRVESV